MKTIEVVAAIIHDNGKILATQRGYGEFKDGWEFPGGKMQPGETPEEAIIREIKEELRITIKPEKLLMTVEYDYPTFHLTMHCFFSVITAGTIELVEHEAMAWLEESQLESVSWLPADIEVVRGHDNAIVEATIPVPIKALGGKKFDVRVCVVNGANQGLKEVLRRIQVDKNRYHFIEVMNCPGGCVNGGGQPVQSAGTAWLHPTMPLPLRV